MGLEKRRDSSLYLNMILKIELPPGDLSNMRGLASMDLYLLLTAIFHYITVLPLTESFSVYFCSFHMFPLAFLEF